MWYRGLETFPVKVHEPHIANVRLPHKQEQGKLKMGMTKLLENQAGLLAGECPAKAEASTAFGVLL